VQRFGSKAGLKRRALLLAWDLLEARTAALAERARRGPQGAVEILVGLSGDYGGIEAFAEGLLLLREDLRDPALRARGAAWQTALCRALDDRFRGVSRAPQGIGLLLAAQWQGALLWWSFDPRQGLQRYVEDSLERFLAAVVPEAKATPSGGDSA
jgi:hypothetical protein